MQSSAIEIERNVGRFGGFDGGRDREEGVSWLCGVACIEVGALSFFIQRSVVVVVLITVVAAFGSRGSVAKSKFELYQDSPEVELRGAGRDVGKNQRFHMRR